MNVLILVLLCVNIQAYTLEYSNQTVTRCACGQSTNEHFSHVLRSKKYTFNILSSSKTFTQSTQGIQENQTVFSNATTVAYRKRAKQGRSKKRRSSCLAHIYAALGTEKYRVTKFVTNHKYYVLFPVALIFNFLSLLGALKRMRNTSACAYIATVAVLDTLTIAFKALKFLLLATGFINGAMCKFIFFTGTVAQEVATWGLVFMTLERMVTVLFPLKAHVFNQKWKRRFCLMFICITVISIAKNARFIWYVTVYYFRECNMYYCNVPRQYRKTDNSFKWPDAIIVSFLPVILVFISNIAITCGLYLARRRHRSLTEIGSKESRVEFQVTVMLLSVSVTFTILTAPVCIMLLIPHPPGSKTLSQLKMNMSMYENYWLAKMICYLFSDLNYCINFFLYCLSGKMFRQDLMKILCRRNLRERAGAKYNTSNTGSEFKTEGSSLPQ